MGGSVPRPESVGVKFFGFSFISCATAATARSIADSVGSGRSETSDAVTSVISEPVTPETSEPSSLAVSVSLSSSDSDSDSDYEAPSTALSVGAIERATVEP